jgi:hypothetical protein
MQTLYATFSLENKKIKSTNVQASASSVGYTQGISRMQEAKNQKTKIFHP